MTFEELWAEHKGLCIFLGILVIGVIGVIIAVIVVFARKSSNGGSNGGGTEGFVEAYTATNDENYADQFKFAESYINSVIGLQPSPAIVVAPIDNAAKPTFDVQDKAAEQLNDPEPVAINNIPAAEVLTEEVQAAELPAAEVPAE